MVLHKVSNFTKKAVTDVNLPGARERGVLHRFDRGLLCRLNVRHLLNEGPATKSGLRNPLTENIFIGLSCGADQCGFN